MSGSRKLPSAQSGDDAPHSLRGLWDSASPDRRKSVGRLVKALLRDEVSWEELGQIVLSLDDANLQEAVFKFFETFGGGLKGSAAGADDAAPVAPVLRLVRGGAPETPLTDEATSERFAVIRKIPLFGDLDDAELAPFVEKIQEVRPKPGTELFRQNKPADAVYFLKEGTVEILFNGEMVAQKSTIECFGEMSCLSGEPNASATVRTVTDCVILKISRSDFLQAVKQAPKIWEKLFLQMLGRFKDMNRRLSEVLNHTPQGLIKVDKKGVVTNEFSIQCTHYFENPKLSGIAFDEVVLKSDDKSRKAWSDIFGEIFGDASLDFGLVAGLLPQETKFVRSDGKTSEYVLTYYPCTDNDGARVAIDVGIEDVTETREFERKTAELEREKTVLRKVYDKPDLYLGLLKMVADAESALGSFAKDARGRDADTITALMRLLHNIKGVSGLFELGELKAAVHELESLLREVEGEGAAGALGAERQARLEAGLVALKAQSEYTQSLMNSIGEDLRNRLLGVVFSRKQFAELKNAVRTGRLKTLKAILESVEKVDAAELFKGWDAEAQALAGKLGRGVKVTVEAEGVQLSQVAYRNLGSPIVHLLRNAVDHGIESPEERKAAGKAVVGSIQVTVRPEDAGGAVIEVKDDGRGVDFDHVIKKARDNASLDQDLIERLVQDGEPWKILFMAGFSTAREVSDISGRGVGLDAVREAVVSLGGRYEVQSEAGSGTTVLLHIPKSHV